MKRETILFLLIVALTSCKKSYTCACGDMNAAERTPVWETKDTKKNAEVKCEDYRQNTNAITNFTCEIQ